MSNPASPPPVEDAELERLINLMDYRTAKALRSRIRELVEEARKEGEASTSREVAQTISRLRTLAADLRGPNVR